MTSPKGYIEIACGYSYAPLRVGLILRAPNGREVYFQPGDDEAAIRETIEALDELFGGLREGAAQIALGVYFD